MRPTPARLVAERLQRLRTHGPAALQPLPDEREWDAAGEAHRRRILDDLRPDLYALSALLAHAVVGCALASRPSYPPYGLARSRFTEWRLVTGDPEPYEDGSVDGFYALWAALVDTTVFHLHNELTARRHAPQAWTVEHLERLLPLFADVDDADGEPRKRDAMTFVYGGLQFGTSVCVQLLEVATRLLRRGAPELPASACAQVLARSSGPAYRLAALGFDEALSTYRGLLSTAADTPERGRDQPGWLDAERFSVERSDGQPWRVSFADADRPSPGASPDRLGCPARIADDDGGTPIGALWEWAVDIARAAGLLEPAGAADGGHGRG